MSAVGCPKLLLKDYDEVVDDDDDDDHDDDLVGCRIEENTA